MVHVVVVAAGPAEGAAFDGVDVGGVDAAAGEEVAVGLREVCADDAAELDLAGEGGGEGGVGGGAAEEFVVDF